MIPFVVLSALIVAGFAFGSWRWVSTRLAVTEASVVYDIEQASDFCAQRLPDEVNQRLDRARLQTLLGLHLAFLRQGGMATFGGVDHLAMAASRLPEAVVAHEDEAVDFVIAAMGELDDPIELVDVVVVVDLSNQYLMSIGAFGPSIQLHDEDDGNP